MKTKFFHWVAWSVIAGVIGACSAEEAPVEAAATEEDAVTLAEGLDGEERAFLNEINAYRASIGAPALQVSVALSNAAGAHSQDMANRNYFSHNSQNGRSPFQRMCDAGYCYSTTKAENIAAGNADAAGTFRQWRNSAGHDANMRNPAFRVIGIGRASSANSTYRWYWTTKFGGHVDEVMTNGGGGGTTPGGGGTTPGGGGGTTPGGGGGTTPGGGGGQCTDSNQNCSYWAGIGECSRNPGYMLTSCCASCESVDEGGGDEPGGGGQQCVDAHGFCSYLAWFGECSRNPAYMQANCCATCSR